MAWRCFPRRRSRQGGAFSLWSRPGRGTRVTAEFQLSHIDRTPLGALAETLATAAVIHPDTDLRFLHRIGARYYRITTAGIDRSGGPVSIANQVRAKVTSGRERIGSTAY